MSSMLTPYQRIAIVVLEKALQDAWGRNERVRSEARRFIERDSPLLEFWCKLAPVSIRTVRKAAAQPPALKRPYPGSGRAAGAEDA